MSYKRIVKKRGKEYGPYIYESYRDGEGNVKKRYMGKKNELNFPFKIIGVVLLVTLLILAFYVITNNSKIVEQPVDSSASFGSSMLSLFVKPLNFILSPKSTGNAVLNLDKIFFLDNYFSGTLKIKMKSGELIPSGSKIIVEQQDNSMEYLLSDVVKMNANGNYFVEDKGIIGSGEGFGFPGEIIRYPEVSFVLKVSQEEGNEIVNGASGGNETSAETTIEQPAENAAETSTNESLANSDSSLTAQVINERLALVNGQVSEEKEFSYVLWEGETAEIVSGSVKSGEKTLLDSSVKLEIQDGKAVVSTIYEEVDSGFGAEFLGSDEHTLDVSLSDLKVPGKNGTLKISLFYNGEKIAEAIKEVSVSGEINDLNEKVIEENETLLKNVVITKQYGAVIGKPVKWIKKISADGGDMGALKIEIPKEAENVGVITGEEVQRAEQQAQQEQNEIESNKNALVTGEISLDIVEGEGLISKIIRWLRFRTGNVISDADVQNAVSETGDSKIVDVSSIVQKTGDSEIAVEYETPAPVAVEEEIANGKQITISAPSELGYTNILAYTELDNRIKMGDEKDIKLYWNNNESGEVVKELVQFDAYDLDLNGYIDYVEWIVPHLSSQVYEIIYITKAVKLDSNRAFIEDIYEQVKERDNNFAEIKAGEYVRVTFEQILDKTKDITLYAKSASGNPAIIEVYAENSDKLITTFNNILNDKEYKVYLTNMTDNESYSTFDLKVLGDVEIDYIVDPAAYCGGTTYDCSVFSSESCNSYYGCNYVEPDCTGGTQSCINLNETYCNVGDCSWTAETPDHVSIPATTADSGSYVWNGVTQSSVSVNVTLNCSDADDVGGAGNCSATYYCTDTSNVCTPNLACSYSSSGNNGSDGYGYCNPINISSPGTNYVRYYSVDGSVNTEIVQSGYGNNNAGIIILSSGGNVSSCQTINQAGTYVLNQSISSTGTCLTITANNTILDGNENNITYNSASGSGYGISVSATSNVTIKNFARINGIVSGGYPIYISGSASGFAISGNNITSTSNGIYFSSTSSNNTISGNNLNSTSNNGIYFSSASSGNNISGNQMRNSLRGIYFSSTSSNDIISGNQMESTSDASQNIYFSSTSSNNTISGNNLTAGYDSIYFSSTSSNNTISGNNITSTAHNGIFFSVSSSSTSNNISGNQIKSNLRGIYFSSTSSNDIISGNNITSTNNQGILFFSTSSNDLISGNNIESSNNTGIVLWGSSSRVIIISNTINAGGLGCNDPSYSCSGIVYKLGSSNNNIISGNVINASQTGAFDIDLLVASNNLTLTNQIVSNYNIVGLSNISFVNSTHGKISLFNMNGTGTDLIGNSASDIKILNNLAYVNSAQTGLNKSANITLYSTGITSSAYMLRNGVVCPAGICSNLADLTGGNYSFSVTGWSNYSIGQDLTAPLVSYGLGTENNNEVTSNLSGIYVNLSVADDNFGNVTFLLYNSAGAEINATSYTTASYTINWTGLSAGDYKYQANITDAFNQKNFTALRNITLLPSCLIQCSELADCNITSRCYLQSSLCTGSICDFRNFRINASLYVLSGSDLDLNLSGNITFIGSGNHFIFSGKNGSSASGGSLGGNAGIINITVPNLFNTTNARFVGLGGYSTKAGKGGNGGTLSLNYKGLLGDKDVLDIARIKVTAGSSVNSTSGTGGSIIHNKNIYCSRALGIYRDADIDGNGKIDTDDSDLIQANYGNVSTDSDFNLTYDINCDSKLNVVELAREGFEWQRGV